MHTASQTLSVGQKAGWGLADMGVVVFVIVKQLLILAFMNSFLGIPIAMAGAGFLPSGSRIIDFGLVSISLICSATINLCSSLQINIGDNISL